MPTKFTYRLQSIETGILAHCCEMSVASEGATEDDAVEALREALIARLTEVEAMAPPARPAVAHVLLSEAEPLPSQGPQGPGEAM
ncbi:MAG: hypothetical protein KBF88_01360 [Polyangiaceae bacterium]|nr:hypothetical protein [Polyangiaceae bacterium]